MLYITQGIARVANVRNSKNFTTHNLSTADLRFEAGRTSPDPGGRGVVTAPFFKGGPSLIPGLCGRTINVFSDSETLKNPHPALKRHPLPAVVSSPHWARVWSLEASGFVLRKRLRAFGI